MMDNQVFPYVEKMLDLTARCQQTFASNIANMDTPGYKARDVEFQQELSATIELAVTDSKHLGPAAPSSGARVFELEAEAKPNGNTVDLEHTMTELTKNGLEYVTLVQYLNQKLKTLRTAITEGGKG